MRNNTTISSFRKLPGGLLVLLLLVVMTEWFVYTSRPDIIQDYWNKFLINEHALVNTPGNCDYLIIGDSIQKTGINPALVRDDILNLGLPGGKPLGLYLLLNRYLRDHNPPKAIFLYVDPEDPRDSLYVILRFFVTIPEALSVWKDLTWRERQVFLMRYWATLDLRKVGLTVRDKYTGGNRVFIETLIKNRGYMSSPRSDQSLSDDYFLTNRERHQSAVTISNRDMAYLDKIMKVAASKNITIVFLGFMLPEQLHGILETTGFNGSYRAFYASLQRRYPQAACVNEPLLYLPNKYFGDMSHVNHDGVQVYTEYFKNRVFLPCVSRLGRR